MLESTVDTNRLEHIFFPHGVLRANAVRSHGDRFAYYTTAEVAFKILQSQQMWLRNALLMNDFSEIAHGYECLVSAYRGPAGSLLKTTLESSMAKLFASEVAVKCANEGVQIRGGYGFIKDYPAEKFYRDVKLCTIGEGTSEIQRLVIARQLLRD